MSINNHNGMYNTGVVLVPVSLLIKEKLFELQDVSDEMSTVKEVADIQYKMWDAAFHQNSKAFSIQGPGVQEPPPWLRL